MKDQQHYEYLTLTVVQLFQQLFFTLPPVERTQLQQQREERLHLILSYNRAVAVTVTEAVTVEFGSPRKITVLHLSLVMLGDVI